MRHRSWSTGIIAIACGLLTNAAPAWAAAPATWVSGTGSDTGDCPITAPCQTFQYAHGQTSAGGTINVLSAGSFGRLTITKSISVVADGVEAAILTAGAIGAGIRIQAGAGDIIALRGLTIDLRGTPNIGISFVSGAGLHVHNSVIRRTTRGINFAPASGTSELYVADSAIANSSSTGIRVEPSGSAGAKVVLERVRVETASNDGILFSGDSTTGSITATVRDSISAGNGATGGSGINASAAAGGGTAAVMIDRSAAVNNANGINANGAATIRIGDSTVTGNTFDGLSIFGAGKIASYGNNKVDGNGTDGNPTSTIFMK